MPAINLLGIYNVSKQLNIIPIPAIIKDVVISIK